MIWEKIVKIITNKDDDNTLRYIVEIELQHYVNE